MFHWRRDCEREEFPLTSEALLSDVYDYSPIMTLHHKKVMKLPDSWEIRILRSYALTSGKNLITTLNAYCCTLATKCFGVMDGKYIFHFVGTPYCGEEPIRCKFSVPCDHETDVYMIHLTAADHLDRPRKQEFVLVGAGSIVKEDG